MNKKRLIATFCMFLIVMLPVCFADEFEQEGETLIIEAKQYEPSVLRSDYMEQLNIPVRVVLGAIRGEPISVPEINSVSVKLIKKQEAQKKNASVEGTSEKMIKDYVQGTPKFYKAPYPTLDNLGFVEITLKKIEKETEVPKQIDLDFEATINYEAEISGFTIGGENQKELKIATVETIKENKEEYQILGGRYYLRVTNIETERATVEVLDPDFKRLTSVSLKIGEPSSSISLSYKDQAEPDHIRLKLEEVRGVGTIKLKFENVKEDKTFEKNKEIERGWKVSNYYIGEKGIEGDEYIILENKEFKTKVILSTEESFDEIKELENLINNCEKSECKIYALSSIKNIKDYPVKKDLFKEALNSLKEIGLLELVKVEPKQTGRVAKIEMGGLDYYFSEDEKIGSSECKCKIYSVTRDEARVSGVKNCDKDARDTEILKTGETYNICGTVLTLKEITTDEKAVITVLPGTGKGKTTTYFSVHIPVEKRAIQYTPEELQAKINKTEALIKKLDNTINQLQKLVEGWTKICLATMAVFTVMAFFQGVSGTPSKKGAGAQAGEPTKPEGEKKILLPEGVTKFSELKYGYDAKVGITDKSIPLKDGETYYFINGAMYDSKNNYIVYQGAKFKHEKSKSWYILNSEGVLEKTEGTYGDWGLGDYSGKYEVRFSSGEDIAVGLQSCNQIPHGTGNYINQCENAKATYGSALVLIYYKKVDSLEVWSAGKDKKLQSFGDGTAPDDKKVFDILPQYTEFKDLKRRLLELQETNKRGEKTYNWGGYKYDMGKTFKSGTTPGDVDCRMVMDESRCKILFNACDPVMCPPSRCNFGGRYKIDNVIQSGLLGSLLLCLPNIKDGVIMPVCLSGILASLKNIRSILQGYVDCLRAALNDQKSVGICDRIRSIFICEILWREAMTMLGMARGNLFDAAVGSGGGEYLTGLKGGVDNAKKTVDFFTNSYASSVFASYKGKSTKEIGSMICEKAIYGKLPGLGEIVEDITKAQNPTQFMAYIEEQPLYQVTEQKSTYKLYYHIYAGSQQIDYKVYVKKGTKTFVCKECSGTIDAEGYVDKSTLFTLEPGYNVICVKIGNKEECNLGKVVSTSFGVNKAYDYVLQHELSKKIETEEDCRADLRGYLPNAQVEKVCSTMNPASGKGKQETDLWKNIGSCGKNKEGAFLGYCWMKLGELEKYNPEAYREVVQGLCKENSAKVCEQYQTCTGRAETTPVTGYKTVVCCYGGECKEDEKYTKTIQTLEEETFLNEKAYKEMYDYGKKKCESTEEANNNPFYPTSSLPDSWIEKQKEVDLGRDKEEQNKYYYFRGAMYLVCGNCADAPKEFYKIDKTSNYFTKACGKNKLDDGGLMLERCKKTCEGVSEKPAEKPAEEKPAETKVLKPTKITLITQSKKEESISISDTKEILLTTGGAYTIKDIIFSDSVKSCYFNFGTDLTSPQVSKTVEKVGTTICKFGDTEFSIVGKSEGLKVEIGGVNEKSSEEFASTFDVKVSEEAVTPGVSFLCKTAGEDYFCINTVEERCSDYFYGSDKTTRAKIYTKLTDTLGGCQVQCSKTNPNQTPEQCTPLKTGYNR